jgi:hypothetical protein
VAKSRRTHDIPVVILQGIKHWVLVLELPVFRGDQGGAENKFESGAENKFESEQKTDINERPAATGWPAKTECV